MLKQQHMHTPFFSGDRGSCLSPHIKRRLSWCEPLWKWMQKIKHHMNTRLTEGAWCNRVMQGDQIRASWDAISSDPAVHMGELLYAQVKKVGSAQRQGCTAMRPRINEGKHGLSWGNLLKLEYLISTLPEHLYSTILRTPKLPENTPNQRKLVSIPHQRSFPY